MIVTLFLEAANGERHTWTNHTVTKKEEISWLLKIVQETLEKILVMKDSKDVEDFKKFTQLDKGEGLGKPINKRF